MKVQIGRSFAIALPLMALSLAVAPGQAEATDGYFAHGVGTRAKGQGGVAIADPQDALGIASNPASAIPLGNRWDAGVEVFEPSRSADIHGNGAGLNGHYDGDGTERFYIPEFGYTHSLADGVAFGVAVYGNGGLNTSYHQNPFASFGGTGYAGVNLAQLFVSPTLAFRVAQGQNLGISLNLAAQGFRAYGLGPFAAYSNDPAHFTDHGTDISYGFGVRVGYLGQLTDKLSLGVTYQSRTEFGDFDKYKGLFASGGSFDVPESYGVGIAYQATEALRLGFDVRRINYSEVDSVGAELGQLFLGNPFGSDQGPGFGWDDVTVYKLGASYRFNPSLTLRAGYSYNTQAIPDDQTLLNVLAPGVVQNQYTLGATWTLPSGLELSGYLLYAPEETVHGSGSIPAGFGGGEADISLSETAIGIALGHSF